MSEHLLKQHKTIRILEGAAVELVVEHHVDQDGAFYQKVSCIPNVNLNPQIMLQVCSGQVGKHARTAISLVCPCRSGSMEARMSGSDCAS